MNIPRSGESEDVTEQVPHCFGELQGRKVYILSIRIGYNPDARKEELELPIHKGADSLENIFVTSIGLLMRQGLEDVYNSDKGAHTSYTYSPAGTLVPYTCSDLP